MMVYVLGGMLGVSLIYSFLLKKKLNMVSEINDEAISQWGDCIEDKKQLVRERRGLLESIAELREGAFDEARTRKASQDVNAVLRSEKEELGSCNQTLKIKVDTLNSKIEDLKNMLKLEDEASCKIIKELETLLENEKALNETYSGYVKYIINAPRAVKRAFVKGECIDWYDENGVLRMKIKEDVK